MAGSSVGAATVIREYGPWIGVASVHGVSFDGAHLWVAAGDRLLAIDAISGAAVGALELEACAGTAWDGEHLYQVGAGVIRKVVPATGLVVATIAIPGDGPVSGLAWSDGSLWLGRDHDRTIQRIDPASGAILRCIEVDQVVTGVTWDGAELWHGSWDEEASGLCRVDPMTGATLERIDVERGTGVTGLEATGRGVFLCGGGPSGTVRAIRPGDGGKRPPA